MALRVRVCRVGEVAPGQHKSFAVDGVTVPVLIANLDGALIATSSMCPHEDVSLARGKRKGNWMICPGHGYRFDLHTGACSHDPRLVLKRYPVTIIGDEVFVDLL